MAAERENRMLEMLLVSIPALPLLAGKVAGLAAAGLLQLGVYLLLALGGAPAMLGLYDIPASALVWSTAALAWGTCCLNV
ncbi:MAG: hypothetical protein LC804_22900 [Acidobacteria bacterium]|nr:hypothetical protein [Acidobacteriota bacterium]